MIPTLRILMFMIPELLFVLNWTFQFSHYFTIRCWVILWCCMLGIQPTNFLVFSRIWCLWYPGQQLFVSLLTTCYAFIAWDFILIQYWYQKMARLLRMAYDSMILKLVPSSSYNYKKSNINPLYLCLRILYTQQNQSLRQA